MTALRSERHKLLVEGDEDKRIIPYLMDAHIVWGEKREEWPTEIQAYDGATDLLAKGQIETQLKAPRLEALGVIVDANDNMKGRWQSVRDRCAALFPDIPESLPAGGLICRNERGLRLGAWIMPDNRTSGMLETFLACLVPADTDTIWTFSCSTVDTAREKGAPFKDRHRDKARIHSWLALQDPPGQSLHLAVLRKILDPRSDKAAPFVDWFVNLFELDDLRR